MIKWRQFVLLGALLLTATDSSTTSDRKSRVSTDVNNATASSEKPHILALLIDDYGWADAGWHRPDGYKEVQTPTLQGLVNEGIELNRNCECVIFGIMITRWRHYDWCYVFWLLRLRWDASNEDIGVDDDDNNDDDDSDDDALLLPFFFLLCCFLRRRL